MFCVKCGQKLRNDDKFCPKCGEKTIYEEFNENEKNQVDVVASTSNEEEQIYNTQIINSEKIEKHILKKSWQLPIISSVIALLCVISVISYETFQNKTVEENRIKAEKMALSGKLNDSKKIINELIEKRPNYAALKLDKKFLDTGISIQNRLDGIKELEKRKDFNKALTLLDEIDESLNKDAPFFTVLKNMSKEKRVEVSLFQVKNEMNSKKTVEELEGLLAKISSFDTKEAKNMQNVIKKHMCEVAYSKGNEFMKKKDFEGAIGEVEAALKYDVSNKKLISFKNTIQKQKESFENAEEQRMEEAMMSAAKEDENNRTNAVEISNLSSYVDGNGDFRVYGTVKNVATRSINTIEIYYSIYDSDGDYLGEDSVYVYPYYLEVGDGGSFENVNYGLYNGDRVEISNIKWYFN